MSCEYSIGSKRFLAIKTLEDNSTEISIYEKDSKKFVTLSLVRWARFLSKLDFIDEQLERLRNGQQVEFQTHIGGKLYASVNYKLKWPMVDLREFYFHPEKGPRASKIGICLHVDQWASLKSQIIQLNNDHECARTAQHCQNQPDHANQQMMNFCGECNPFALDLMFASVIESKF